MYCFHGLISFICPMCIGMQQAEAEAKRQAERTAYTEPTQAGHTSSNSAYSAARAYMPTSNTQTTCTSVAPPRAVVAVNSAALPAYREIKPRSDDARAMYVLNTVHDIRHPSTPISKSLEVKTEPKSQQKPENLLASQVSNKIESSDDVNVKDTLIVEEHKKINNLIKQVLEGLKSYRKLPRTMFGSHLGFFAAMFDNKRGLIRANVYHEFLTNPRYDIAKKCLMVYALLTNSDGPELKRQVMRATGLKISDGISQISDYMRRYHRGIFIRTDTKRIIKIINNKPEPNVFLGI